VDEPHRVIFIVFSVPRLPFTVYRQHDGPRREFAATRSQRVKA
jgi:hypothetical protein